MDARWFSQIKTNDLLTTQQNAALCGPARQIGAGACGSGPFAMRMGRLAIPIVRKYILLVAVEVGKNLLDAAISEIGHVLAGRMRHSARMLKHIAETAAEKSRRTSRMRLTAGRAATPGDRLARGRVVVAKPRLTSIRNRKGRKSVPPAVLLQPKTVYKQNPAKWSWCNILSEIRFSLKK